MERNLVFQSTFGFCVSSTAIPEEQEEDWYIFIIGSRDFLSWISWKFGDRIFEGRIIKTHKDEFMEAIEFFQQFPGKWFSQRTSHQILSQQMASSRADLWIEWLEPSDASVQKLCNVAGVPSEQAFCGMRSRWEGIVGTDPNQQKGSSLLVWLASEEDKRSGLLLQQAIAPGAVPRRGSYALNSEDVLQWQLEDIRLRASERLWFASPKLRLRSAALSYGSTHKSSQKNSFYSESRMGDA